MAADRTEEEIHLNNTLVESNGPRNIAHGLTAHILEARNCKSQTMITKGTTTDDLFHAIESYFNALENIEETYTRKQLIQDVILMTKDGNAAAAKILIDMLNLDSAQETYDVNIIDFSSAEIAEDFFKVK